MSGSGFSSGADPDSIFFLFFATWWKDKKGFGDDREGKKCRLNVFYYQVPLEFHKFLIVPSHGFYISWFIRIFSAYFDLF